MEHRPKWWEANAHEWQTLEKGCGPQPDQAAAVFPREDPLAAEHVLWGD